jgi:outer membrane protein insertion porin family
LRTNLGYGDGYGGTDELPFFENFFAGGLSQGVVRGFDENSLGPRSTNPRQYVVGPAGLLRDADGNIVVDEGGQARFDGQGYVTRPVFDANGDPVLDADGNQHVQLAVETIELNRRIDAFGGNILTTGSVELLFPTPFVEDRARVRTAFFFDVGTVFSSNCSVAQRANGCSRFDVDELRYSAGVSLSYLSPFGPLTFYLARPYSRDSRDRTKRFDFTIGAGF